MLIRLIIAYILNLFDLGMTQYFIGKYDISIEGNPIGRWLFGSSEWLQVLYEKMNIRLTTQKS